ncbi:Nose resistant to fluoxetine protein 6, partial [Fragariocoptes setiger]
MKASTAVFHCLAVCNVLASTSKILTSAVQVISTNEEDVYRHENDHSDYAKYVRSYLPQARDNASYYPPGLAEREWRLMFSKLDTSVNEATSSSQDLMGSFNIVQKMDQYLDPQCRESMAYMRHAASHHKLWALRMADANGKLQSGIMYGKFSSPGDWEECVRIRAPPEIWNNRVQSFRGKYCLIDFRLPMPERPYDRALSVHEPVLNLTGTESARLYPSIINYTAYASVFYELGYLHALCLPSNCDANNVAQAIGKVVEGIHLIVSNQIDCQYDSDTIWDRLRVSTIISILLLVALFTVTFTSSWLYYKHRQYPDSKSMARHMPVIKCFAMQPNFERLTKPDPRSLTFVHYTRIVAMGLTVVTHTGGLGTLQAITKPADGTNAESIFRDFLPQMMANAFTSIQVFFFMAGLMLVLSTWPAMRRSGGKLSFIEYAIKRAVRLLPGIIITIALNFIWPLFASDYQLHLLAFPILIITYHKPNVGLGIASVLTVSGFMAQFIMVATKTVLPFMMVDYLDK